MLTEKKITREGSERKWFEAFSLPRVNIPRGLARIRRIESEKKGLRNNRSTPGITGESESRVLSNIDQISSPLLFLRLVPRLIFFPRHPPFAEDSVRMRNQNNGRGEAVCLKGRGKSSISPDVYGQTRSAYPLCKPRFLELFCRDHCTRVYASCGILYAPTKNTREARFHRNRGPNACMK